MTKNKFEQAVEKLRQEFGEPIFKKRLSIEVDDWNDQALDTRIRITDGKPELMQKMGDWNSDVRHEIKIPLEKNAEVVLNTFKIFVNLLKDGDLHANIIQLENYIFKTNEVEIKISHQFGKSSKYNFEIEALTDEVDLLKIAEKLNLKPCREHRGPEFWTKWNQEVNLDALKFDDEKLLEIVREYLN